MSFENKLQDTTNWDAGAKEGTIDPSIDKSSNDNQLCESADNQTVDENFRDEKVPSTLRLKVVVERNPQRRDQEDVQ